MSEFLDRISKLSPQRLALLADELNERLQAAERQRKVPLAIVGIGCRMPGGVSSPEEFWKLLRDGTDAVSEVPASRWDIEELYSSNPDEPGKMTTRWGGFVEGFDQFDPKFFGIAPAEATSMDPQQRLLLETTWEALEDGGIAPNKLSGAPVGVFVGICNGDYGQVAFNAAREEITPYFAPGLSHAIAAGRISYVLGLQGPSMAVDTSCSASLVAVHLACQSLRLGECEMALAGGVNLIFNPDVTIALSQSKMMAPDGRCKAFSDSANGFVRGEGCSMIVLKRLPDAIRDGNRILAVIRGTACNQDGRSNGLTAPNGPSQEAVITAALADAGMQPDAVDVIEAHGTGTSLGDPIEVGALGAVFSNESRKSDPLFVGSVKTNLGHLESAAGIAGLIKLVLSMRHGKIPASLHLDKPNSRIEWERLPIKIPTKLEQWKRRGQKRVAGVSSFGFSGTNAHVIVEEYLEDVSPTAIADEPLLFTLSARTPSALASVAARLRQHLTEYSELPLVDIAHTINAGRSHFEYRAAPVAGTREELLRSLNDLQQGKASSVQTGRAAVHSPHLTFVFGNSLSHCVPVIHDLYGKAPEFREAVRQCEEILRNELNVSFDLDFNRKAEDPPDVSDGQTNSKIVTFVLQYALVELWRACGIWPSAVIGHQAGEYAAACVAGVFSLRDGLRLVLAEERENPDEFDKCALGISYHEPRTPFLFTSNEKSVSSADYWLRRSHVNTSSPSASTFAKEGNSAHLYIGSTSDLEHLVKSLGTTLPGKCIASLGNQESSREVLNAAAELYILGCDLQLDNFYRDNAKTIALPTYPFERERYWIEAETRRESAKEKASHASANVTPASPGGPAPQETRADDWIYDLVWQPKPLAQKISGHAIAPLDKEFLRQIVLTPATPELMRIDSLTAKLLPIYATYILQAFREAGLPPLKTSYFTVDEISLLLKIIPARRRVLGRLLDILVEDNIVEKIDDRFRFVDFKPRPDADRELERLSAEYPEGWAELNILRRCGKKLAAVLQGTYDPMQLVFADGSIEEAEQIYGHSPVCCFFNDKTTEVIRAIANQITGRPVRILEIGAGTGSTTRPVLSGLNDAKADFDYVFTDISPVFLSRARTKFAHVPSMSYRVLNIENDPGTQGFETGTYDIVLAANVLHATADLRRTIAHARKLLAPGGFLILLEGVRPDRWLDMTLGLTDGWWRFVDFDLRAQHPLISSETWADLLREAGMNFTQTISYVREDRALSQQVAIVAQVDTESVQLSESSIKLVREWIILADDYGIGDSLQRLLSARGEVCEIIRRSDSTIDISTVLRSLEKCSDDTKLEFVYLWDIDTALLTDDSDKMLSQGIDLCSKTLVHAIQAMLASRNNPVHCSIVTRGAQATESFSPDVEGTVQSLSWGIGRVFSLESPKQSRALIDLDPTENQNAAVNLFKELLADDREDQIAYRGGQRLVARLQRSSLKHSTKPASEFSGLREDGSYLLVGGLGGLGLRLAKWAAMQGPGHLILLGRTGIGSKTGPFADERLSVIEQIRKQGVNITIIEGDVASEADMKALFLRFGGDLPPLRGVFHVATVVSAGGLGELTDEQLDNMFQSKVWGTWALHKLTKHLDLDFFVAFSSAASVIGAKGMAHYAAANQFLDSFAHYRRGQGLPMLSINWGAWEVMRLVSQPERSRFSQQGLRTMDSEILFRFIGELLYSDRAQVMIADIDWQTLKPLFEVHRIRPLLENVGNVSPMDESVIASPTPPQTSFRAALDLAPENRKKHIESFVVEQASRVLGYRRGEILPVDVPLIDIGLDSLMAVDLRNHLQKVLGQDLSPTVIFDYPTVSEIVGMLETRLWASQVSSEDHLVSSQKDEIRI